MAYAGKVGETTPSVRAMAGTPRPVGAVATGVAIGLLVGAGMALLLAPQAGADTRRRVAKGLTRAKRRGTDVWDDLRFELRHARRRLNRARRSRDLEAVG